MIFNILGYAIKDKARQNAITRAMKKFWEVTRKKYFFFWKWWSMRIHVKPKFFHFQFFGPLKGITRDKSFSILEPQVQTTSGSAFK